MLERYSIGQSAEEIKQRFQVEATDGYEPRYNAAPTQLLPVITNQHPEGFSFFYWGQVPQWSNNRAISWQIDKCRGGATTGKSDFEKCTYKQTMSGAGRWVLRLANNWQKKQSAI